MELPFKEQLQKVYCPGQLLLEQASRARIVSDTGRRIQPIRSVERHVQYSYRYWTTHTQA